MVGEFMSNIEDIAKLAIEEISAEFDNGILEDAKTPPLNEISNQTNPKNNSQNISEPISTSENNASSNAQNNGAKPIKSIAQANTQKLNPSQQNPATQESQEPDNEQEFLINLKERIEVLFAGLNANDENTAVRLDLTIRFLEFLLAKIQNRLENLPK
ncbi:MAG: invasion antigen D [Candidatus Campylobacter infans]|nr:MAG: invasion antigen D [Candidatus Campylobacter infans]